MRYVYYIEDHGHKSCLLIPSDRLRDAEDLALVKRDNWHHLTRR